ncbi:MAG: RsmD family RNA methyltransferase [Phycisphaeraceae bacterium]|nr:RsmD family RNA methyltransferase [Phycisphaeraceae bacterium]MCW5754732.1 RsmD family RNA methyltransferase [Phycisphaeraceae bacterium]
MRIIGGELRRRQLLSPPEGTITRPMPDMVREALFNLLRGHCEKAAVFDGFSGTGALGLEAVSRGASRCVCVERDRRMAEVLSANVRALGVEDRVEVVIGDVLGPGALARCPRPVHLVFFDPPYPMVRSEAGWHRIRLQFARFVSLLDDTGYAILRTPWPFVHDLDDEPAPAQAKRPSRTRGKRWKYDPVRDPQSPHEEWFEGEALESLLADPECAAESADSALPESGSDTTPPPIPGDLRVEGAVGPETHVYGHTAVHLYMRQRNA